MADNVAITAGSGTSVATDEIGGVHHQRVKVSLGADGTAADLPGDGTNGADVDVTRVIPGTSATHLGKAEDAPSSSGDTGIFILAVRNDAAGPLTGADGDYSAISVNVNGLVGIWDGGGSITVDGTFWQATQPVSAASLPLPTGASTSAKQPALGTAGTASADVITVQGVTSMTPLLATLSGTNNIATVTTVTTVGAVTAITNALPAGNNNIGDVDVASVPTDPFGANADAASATGSISAKLRFIAGTGIPITGTVTVGTHAVTQSGTWTVVCSNSVAHDAADADNPVKIGMRAETSPKGVTLVADGDRTDVYADADGIPIVKLNTSGADAVSERVSNTDGASTAFSNFGAVANLKNAITAITVLRTDAGTSMAYVDFRDGTAGSILYTVPLPPLGGSIITLGGMPLFKTTANTALAFDVSSALTTVYLSVSGFQTKV